MHTPLLNVLLMLGNPGTQGGNPIAQFLPIILIIVVFYFFMIRPQTKKAKAEKEFKENLQKGTKIVTIGGVHGKIVDVNDTTFMMEVENGVKMKIEKSAVSMDATKTVNKDS